MKWLALACLGVVLTVGSLAGGCAILVFRAKKPAMETTEKFLQAASEGRWADAKAVSDSPLHKPLDGIFEKHPVLFGKSWKSKSWRLQTSNGVNMAVFTYELTGTDGKVRTARFTLKEFQKWIVIGIRVDGERDVPADLEK